VAAEQRLAPRSSTWSHAVWDFPPGDYELLPDSEAEEPDI